MCKASGGSILGGRSFFGLFEGLSGLAVWTNSLADGRHAGLIGFPSSRARARASAPIPVASVVRSLLCSLPPHALHHYENFTLDVSPLSYAPYSTLLMVHSNKTFTCHMEIIININFEDFESYIKLDFVRRLRQFEQLEHLAITVN